MKNPAPTIENTPRYVQVGDGYAATLVVTGYPAEVGPAWLDPLLAWPGRLDVVVHLDPLPAPVAATQLRRQRARLESTRRDDAATGRLGDPLTDAAAEDAAELADRVARGESKLFRVGLYLSVHAQSVDELDDAVADVRATAASMLLDTQPATWRQLQGWTTCLPLATDGLNMRRVMDTEALAAMFPLASPDLPAPLPGEPAAAGGVLYGLNPASHGVVWWDRWTQHNANSVVLARSGAGKSYLVKLEILRSLADGVHVSIIDPDNEYLRLVDAVGGVTLALGAEGVRLNPLDIPPGDRRPQARTYRALFLHTLIAVLLGHQPPPTERAALDGAINTAYNNAGITNDPATWRRPAPLLRDVADALTAQDTAAGTTLAARLAPWTTGSFRHLFDGPTTTVPSGQLVCWSTRQLPDELRAPGMLLALDAIWRDVDTPVTAAPRRLVVVDEAWTLLRDGEGARFLARLAKSARKRRAGLAVITQDVGDLLGSELGQIVIANAATQILLRQAPQAIELVADAFGLTGGEARQLLSAGRGQGLLLSGTHRVAFDVVASPREHQLCTGDLELS
ncbi:VirB4 family type IV secretion system protein [Cryptosporangium arvum]|uniref:TraG P-loop domain-containing protein n=1 Tax=Cryptosporangium arvum DSM 44712 TaxID=927661 RepID=A0A010Z3N6_9ACTN|nr:DUF87 domain-containing protein [Cryptosporangium arvum]EXG82008.1 protein of unknown function DUF87 [Cryptosporangium arvum DSM 44712]